MDALARVQRDVQVVMAAKDKIEKYLPLLEKLDPLLKALAPDAFAELMSIKEKIGPLVGTLEEMVAEYKARKGAAPA